jgi:HSP20 family protein
MTRPIPWRRDLSAPFHLLQSELNRLMEDYWNPARLGATQPPPMDLEPTGWSPAIDLFETPSEFLLVAELPGVDPSSIDLSVTGSILSLRGVKTADGMPEGHGPIRERRFGTFHRQIPLSNEVNFDSAQAEARNGVLKVRLPKQEAARPRTIPVQHI